jgi:hypothetical protein
MLSFDPAGVPAVAVEADPLGSPNAFAPLDVWWVSQSQWPKGIKLISTELTGASGLASQSAAAAAVAQPLTDAPAFASITFLPDGSSDSARITLAGSDDTWQVRLDLNGLDGSVVRTDVAGEEP